MRKKYFWLALGILVLIPFLKAKAIVYKYLDFTDTEKKYVFRDLNTKYGNLDVDGYELSKVNEHDFLLKLKNVYASEIILPQDDADIGRSMYDEEDKPRESYVTVILEGDNYIYGTHQQSGFIANPTKGTTITGSGNLTINAHQGITTWGNLTINGTGNFNINSATRGFSSTYAINILGGKYKINSHLESLLASGDVSLTNATFDSTTTNNYNNFESYGNVNISNSTLNINNGAKGLVSQKLTINNSNVNATGVLNALIASGNIDILGGQLIASSNTRRQAAIDSAKSINLNNTNVAITALGNGLTARNEKESVITVGKGTTLKINITGRAVANIYDCDGYAFASVNDVVIKNGAHLDVVGPNGVFLKRPKFEEGPYYLLAGTTASNDKYHRYAVKRSKEYVTTFDSEVRALETVYTNDTTSPVISGLDNNAYCEAPLATVTDENIIDSITVNGSKIKNYLENKDTKKSFVIPNTGKNIKDIIVKDLLGNTTKKTITVYNSHSLEPKIREGVKPTCDKKGYHYVDYYCTHCHKLIKTEVVTDEATGHVYGAWQISGTTKTRTCQKCGHTESENITINTTKVVLSTVNYNYDGKAKTPSVTVKDDTNKVLKINSDYTVKYSNNVNAGTATVTVTGKNNYRGEVKKTFTIKKIDNTLTASNITKSYNAKSQSFNLNAKQKGNAKLTYSSNNKNISVDKNGKVTIKAGYVGKANITITAPATNGYNKATKTITVTVNKINNSLTVSNVTKSYNAKAQSFNLNTKQKGNAKLTYSSNNKNINVDKNGKVTIKAGYVGKANITITAPATNGYNKATKTITVTCNPTSAQISKITNSSSKKITVKWNKNKIANGYQIQYSQDKNFKKDVKTITINKNNILSKDITNLIKNKTYYVRVRTYKTISKVNYYSYWSKVQKILIKK